MDLTEIGVWIELLEKSRLHWTTANHNSTENTLVVTTPLPANIANLTKTCSEAEVKQVLSETHGPYNLRELCEGRLKMYSRLTLLLI